VAQFAVHTCATPVGPVELVSNGSSLTRATIGGCAVRGTLHHQGVSGAGDEVTQLAAHQLSEYFAGARREFTVPLELAGTEFQVRVWSELAAVEYGTTVSYGELARRAGHPSAGRAVGAAVGANPLAVFIPCHRVVSSTGAVTGFSLGDGLPTKRGLAQVEGITFAGDRG
jgi:methylated-DNA-[protein]-cysteine S-methyltransferase